MNDSEPKTKDLSRRYLLVTPCRNEEDYLQVTIDSIGAQTVLPACWVIVDDGSTDRTPEILKAACEKYPFINVVERADRGERAVGPGVIQAFNDGLDSIDLNEFDYLCKLDADLGIPETYFENMMIEMEADPLLGNLSGKTYIKVSGDRWVSERMGDENAIGPAKFYRRECFEEIGGFVPQVCWDGIDGHVCRMMGWKALSLDVEAWRLQHYRPHGTSYISVWEGRKRWGLGKFFMGSSLLYMIGVMLFRMVERPFVVGGVGIFVGYLNAWRSGMKRYGTPEYIKHLHRYEFDSLVFGKRRALARFNRRLDAQRAL
ncbi:MAG: glycosyltransferase [Phycisphaerales bacterium]|nr:glycosyltransferase [Phycisphaerales bacterium]